jgi:2-methylcitrate dehydratase PrpD
MAVPEQGAASMESTTRTLLDLINALDYEALPPEMVHESKRILFDSIGVAIAALETEKGRYGLTMARKLGLSSESRILGTNLRASAGGAAFANSELMNALDFDSAMFPTHAPPVLIPASLALGESAGASGKDMILSVALGCEVSLRLAKAIRGLKKVFTSAEGSETGKVVGTKHSVSAIAVAVIGGAIGAAKIMGLNREALAHATGLAAHFTPIPQSKWKMLDRMPMTKYMCAGWASLAEVSAVLMADMGYTADTTPLDGELGFWRFFGSDRWNPEVLTKGLGNEWLILGAIEYKPYPCMRDFHVALDCVRRIIEANDLIPEEIDRVRIQTHPSVVSAETYRNKDIRDHIEAQFSLPYVIACAANKISLAEWQDPNSLSDPKIRQFMDKIIQEAHPDFVKVQLEEPLANMTTVEIYAKGKLYKEDGKYPKGLPRPEFARMTDRDLIEKFKINVSKVFAPSKVEKAIDVLLNLEYAQNISEISKHVTHEE